MEQLSAAATTVSGIVAIVLLVLSAIVVFAMRGQVRTFLAAIGLGLGIILAAVALITTTPQGNVGPEALAGLEVDIPDTDRELAEAFVIRAEQELNRGDARSALDSYGRARSQYRKMGDILGEAQVAFGLGRMEHFTGQSDKARANYSEAVSLYEQGGSAQGQAQVLAALGDLEKDTFNWDAARQHYRNARIQWGRAPGPKSDPHVLLGIDDLAAMPNGETEARDHLEQAQKLYFVVDDNIGKGDITSILGDLEMNLGNYAAARSKFADARAIYRGTDARTQEAQANLSLAIADLQAGFNQDVEMALDFATILFADAGEAAGTPRVAIVRGRLEMMVGQWEAARDLFAQAATDLNALSHKEEAAAILGVGDAEFALGNTEAAIAAFSAANDLYRRFGFAEGEAKALLGLAILAADQDQTRTATEALLRAGILFSEAKKTLGAARTLATFASVLSRTDDVEGALQMFREAIPMFERESAPTGKILATLGTGDLSRQIGRDADAATAYRQANDWFAEMELPVAEANRYLGLPAVETISIRFLGDGEDPYDMAPAVEPEPGTVIDYDLLDEENLAKFPNQNAQARALVADLEARLTEAMAFVDTLN